MQGCRNFILEECLPAWYFKKMYRVYGKRLWSVFDDRLLITRDRLRARYGVAIMNTWHSEKMMEAYGLHQWRGYRDSSSPYVEKNGTNPFGNISQHRFGRADDIVFLEVSAADVRSDILADPFHPDFEYITCIEDGVTWLHYDVRSQDKIKNGILIVPKT